MTSALIDAVRFSRPPDMVIGDPKRPYMHRWWLHRDREPGGYSIYIHRIMRDDDDQALHDHPWDSTSIVLDGVLREIRPDGAIELTQGARVSRKATDAHRLEIIQGPVWTLFITGEVKREWGFHCPNGWVHWREFVKPDNPGEIGRGCGEP